MKPNAGVLVLAIAFFLHGHSCRANAPPPPELLLKRQQEKQSRGAKNVSLAIHGQPTSGVRLVLPATLIKDLLSDSSSGQSFLGPGRSSPPWRSVVTGLALSLAIVSAGLCLGKSKTRPYCGVMVLLGAVVVTFAVGCPPLPIRDDKVGPAPKAALKETREGILQGGVTIESSDTAEGVEVIADRDALSRYFAKTGVKVETEK